MKVIGLVGGIASGKSLVAEYLEERGAAVFHADAAAHQAIDSPSVKQTLVERWGRSILDAAGNVDRKAVGKIVFAADAKGRPEKQFLEQTLHPQIRRQFVDSLSRWENAGTDVAVLDAPLLLEAGWQDLCDIVLFIDSPREKRLERAKQRNWTEAEFSNREGSQMPIEEKKRLATHVMPNHDTVESLRHRVTAFWESLMVAADKR